MTQPGRDKVGTTGLGCATIMLWARGYSALGMKLQRSGRVHNMAWARTRQGCAHDKGVLSQQTWTVIKKKKKTPEIWGITAWYQSLGIRIART